MTFREFYCWMIEFEPLSSPKAHALLLRILAILSGNTPKRLLPPREQDQFQKKGGTMQ